MRRRDKRVFVVADTIIHMVLETDLEERAKHGQVGLDEKAAVGWQLFRREIYSEISGLS